jgi:23S rRNA G2445 N2-methylase RlmL
MDLTTKNKIVVSCSPGLVEPVANELIQLGYAIKSKDHKAVIIEGNFNDVMTLNFKLRTANKILWHIASFKAIHPNQLYKNAIKIQWEDILKPDGYFSIDSFVKNDFIKDTRFANLKLKDAIADRFTNNSGKRPDSGSGKDDAVIFMRWMDEYVELYFDTSGQSIAKHGYRRFPGPAPLMENLAAAVINATQWDCQSHFINPMCGSGTLAIEAALMAVGLYPGRFRKSYGFQHLADFSFKQWYELRDQMESETVLRQLPFRIIASDISRKMVDIAKENAKLAGVDHLIDFRVCSFERTTIPEGKGVVIMNPEYGERMGEEEKLEQTYQEIGDFMKQKCGGYLGYIFTGNLELAKKVGLRTKSRTPFYNGKIECRLLEYELY